MSSRPTIDLRADPEADLSEVASVLRGGGAAVYPTETVYGIGGACTPEGVARVRALKARSPSKPLIILVRSMEDVSMLSWTDEARELAKIFWPGALTLILEDLGGWFPDGVRDPHTGTVAARVSPHPTVTRLLETLEGPLTSTSLNLPGESPATSADEAHVVLDRLGADDVWVLNGGTLPPSAPSTVVDCSGPKPMVVREGSVPVGRLRCAIPEIHGHESE